MSPREINREFTVYSVVQPLCTRSEINAVLFYKRILYFAHETERDMIAFTLAMEWFCACVIVSVANIPRCTSGV